MEWERQCHRWDSFPRPELTTTEHLFPAHRKVPLHTQQGPTSPQEVAKVSGLLLWSERDFFLATLAQCPTCELLQHRSKVSTCMCITCTFPSSPNTPAFSQAAVAMLTQIHLPRLTQTDPYALTKVTALTIHLPFVGFTYTNGSKLCGRPPVSSASESGAGMTSSDIMYMYCTCACTVRVVYVHVNIEY